MHADAEMVVGSPIHEVITQKERQNMTAFTNFHQVVEFARNGSRSPDSCVHGDEHWRAVTSMGLWLAQRIRLGTKTQRLIFLFGALHDCRRHNDNWDPEHGQRAADAICDGDFTVLGICSNQKSLL